MNWSKYGWGCFNAVMILLGLTLWQPQLVFALLQGVFGLDFFSQDKANKIVFWQIMAEYWFIIVPVVGLAAVVLAGIFGKK